jgi:hypothetical protein
LLKPRLFVKALYNKCVKAGSLSFLILGYSTKVIKRALNSTDSLSLADLVLNNIVVVEGFYINIPLSSKILSMPGITAKIVKQAHTA